MVKCMWEQADLKLRTNHSLSNTRHSSLQSRCGRNTNVITKLLGTVAMNVLPDTRKLQTTQTISTLIVDYKIVVLSLDLKPKAESFQAPSHMQSYVFNAVGLSHLPSIML